VISAYERHLPSKSIPRFRRNASSAFLSDSRAGDSHRVCLWCAVEFFPGAQRTGNAGDLAWNKGNFLREICDCGTGRLDITREIHVVGRCGPEVAPHAGPFPDFCPHEFGAGEATVVIRTGFEEFGHVPEVTDSDEHHTVVRLGGEDPAISIC